MARCGPERAELDLLRPSFPACWFWVETSATCHWACCGTQLPRLLHGDRGQAGRAFLVRLPESPLWTVTVAAAAETIVLCPDAPDLCARRPLLRSRCVWGGDLFNFPGPSRKSCILEPL